MSSAIDIKSTVRVHGGQLIRFSHQSSETKTPMVCAVYLPAIVDRMDASRAFPSIIYLSGLTCTDENVCQKGHPYRALAEAQIAFIAPDTSPRGAGVPGEDETWDFGTGAGFYVDATAKPWSANYRMFSYITAELPRLLAEHFPCLDASRRSITGHSMGGHGALVIALRSPGVYRSVSAFAPICHPSACPWGTKAFEGYLGTDRSQWSAYDAAELMQAAAFDDILVDVGSADSFLLSGQLLPEVFQARCEAAGQTLTLRRQEGYDHSYFFISSFMEQHIAFHADRLLLPK